VCSLTGWPQNGLQQLRDLWIVQPIVDKLTIFAIRDHPGLPQHPQLLRDVGLGPPQHCLEVTHTRLIPPQFVQDAQPRQVR